MSSSLSLEVPLGVPLSSLSPPSSGTGLKGRRRQDSMVVRNIEEKKEHLYSRQSKDYAAWIENFLDQPPIQGDLMAALQSGFILCQITKAIDPNIVSKLDGFKYPLKESRLTNLFQSLENIRCFLAACQLLGVKEVDLFEPDDLIEGLNKLKVLRTLQVLRKMVDKSYVEVSYEKYGTAQFDVNFLETKKPVKPTEALEVHPLDQSLLPKPVEDHKPRNVKVGTVKGTKAMSLFEGMEDEEEEVEPIPPSKSRRASTDLLKPEDRSKPVLPEAVEQTPPKPTEPTDNKPVVQQQQQQEEIIQPQVVPEEPKQPEPKQPEPEPEQQQKPAAEEHEEEPVVLQVPSFGEVATTIMVPIADDVSEADPSDRQHEPFVEDMLDDDIVRRLLSKTVSDDEGSGSDDEEDDDEDWSWMQGDGYRQAAAPVTSSTEVVVRSLRAEVEELQEILKTEVVAHVKEQEHTAEFIAKLQKHAEECEARAQQAERLFKGSEDRIRELELKLSLMSQENSKLQTSVVQAEEAAAAAAAAAKEAQRKAEASAALEKARVRDEHQAARETSERISEDLSSVLYKVSEAQLWRHQPGVSSVIANLPEKEQSRQEVIWELISTEEAYAADLDLVIRLFMNPMTTMVDERTFPKAQLTGIFANIDQLFKVNSALFADLKARQKEQWPVIKNISDIIRKHAPEMSVYTDYCGNQKRAMRELTRAIETSALVKSHLELCQHYKECRKLGLSAFLLLPMQRITKYPLLIKNLIRVTDVNHPDFQATASALTEMIKVIDMVNQHAKIGDDLERVYELDAVLDWSKLPKSYSIVTFATEHKDSGERYLIREGDLGRIRLKNKSLTRDKTPAKKNDRLHVVLLSDLLLFCRVQPIDAKAVLNKSGTLSPSKGTVLSYVMQVEPLTYNDFKVRSVPDGNNGIGAENIFLVSGRTIGTIVLQAETSEEKRAWIGDFRRMGVIAETLGGMTSSPSTELLDSKAAAAAAATPTINTAPPATTAAAAAVAAASPVTSSSPRTSLDQPGPRLPSSVTLPGRRSIRTNSDGESLRPSSMVFSASGRIISGKKSGNFAEDARDSRLMVKPSAAPRFVEPPVPNIVLRNLGEPEFDGWLKMKTTGQSQWKLRFFLLKDFCLYYFNSEKPESKALGMIMMPSYHINEIKEAKKPNMFQVVHPSSSARPYLLLADTHEYMEVWIEALTHATMARIARRNFWL